MKDGDTGKYPVSDTILEAMAFSFVKVADERNIQVAGGSDDPRSRAVMFAGEIG